MNLRAIAQEPLTVSLARPYSVGLRCSPSSSSYLNSVQTRSIVYPILSPLILKGFTAALPGFQPVRTLTKFSRQKGKRKSVKAVLKRFKRLDWGIWIRTKSGRHKKLWKKTSARKRRLRQHVFTNSTQSWLLDKMVTKFWKRPKFYINDPYTPYHTREEFEKTRKRS